MFTYLIFSFSFVLNFMLSREFVSDFLLMCEIKLMALTCISIFILIFVENIKKVYGIWRSRKEKNILCRVFSTHHMFFCYSGFCF